DGTYVSPTANYTYDVAIKQNGQIAFSQSNLFQYHNSTWHELIASNPALATHVVRDVPYLEETKAVPAYDLSTGLNQSAITGDVTALATGSTGPMGSALVEKLMPTVGGRHDLGIMTAWSADDLVAQTADAQKVMLANADAAGSVPWHFNDEATGAP